MAPSGHKDDANLGPAPITAGGTYNIEVAYLLIITP